MLLAKDRCTKQQKNPTQCSAASAFLSGPALDTNLARENPSAAPVSSLAILALHILRFKKQRKSKFDKNILNLTQTHVLSFYLCGLTNLSLIDDYISSTVCR
jgi:hypothetical protein